MEATQRFEEGVNGFEERVGGLGGRLGGRASGLEGMSGVERNGGLGGDVTEEIVERIGIRIAEREDAGGEEVATDAVPDSWVDAVVTLIAVVIFGLGWVLVELEGADAPTADYDAVMDAAMDAAMTVEVVRMASLDSAGDPSYAEYAETGWAETARKNSRR